METLNMTVAQFANHYLPSNAKIKVVKRFNTIFEGNLDELYYAEKDVLKSVVAMIEAENGTVCLSCRN